MIYWILSAKKCWNRFPIELLSSYISRRNSCEICFDILDTFPKSMEDESSSSSLSSCLFVSIDPKRLSIFDNSHSWRPLFIQLSLPIWRPSLAPSHCYLYLPFFHPPSLPAYLASLSSNGLSLFRVYTSRTEAGQLWPGSGHHNALITPHDNTATEFETHKIQKMKIPLKLFGPAKHISDISASVFKFYL